MLSFPRVLSWLVPLASSRGVAMKHLGAKRLPNKTEPTERAAKRARAAPASSEPPARTPTERIESVDWDPLIRRCARRLGWSLAHAADAGSASADGAAADGAAAVGLPFRYYEQPELSAIWPTGGPAAGGSAPSYSSITLP